MKRALAIAFAIVIVFAAANIYDPVVAQSDRIQIIPEPDSVEPSTRLTVLIADGGLNDNAGRIDKYEADGIELVTFRTDRSELGEASPDLEETGKNTGVFAFMIQLETDEESCYDDHLTDSRFDAVGGSEPSIGACPGDNLYISYEDFHADSGGEEVISISVPINSWDPEFTADRASYSPDDRIAVEIFDPDANRDPDIADSLKNIRVTSESDLVGNELSALETGDDTGVFRLTFTTSTLGQGSAILVGHDDEVTVEYTDEFPADFDFEEKIFTFTIPMPIYEGSPVEPSSPRVITNGAPAAGKQAMLSVEITNPNANPQPLVQLVEVRDTNGVTVFLAWQSMVVDPSGQTEIGVSWTPDRADSYQIRTFAVSGFENPRVLSTVQSTDVTIS
jgi:hypothetical protein